MPVGLGTKVREGVAEAVGVSVTVGRGVFVGIALCVSASVVPTVAMAVSMISASLIVGVDRELLQDASMIAGRNKKTSNVLPKMFILPLPLLFYEETP